MSELKANELRIGNWVYDNFNDECYPVPLSMITEAKDQLSPIPLTEEWLVKLGFVSNPYEDRYEKGDFHIHCDKTKGFLDLWVTNCRLDLQHVHQLQNLYFALTGKELTIKE